MIAFLKYYCIISIYVIFNWWIYNIHLNSSKSIFDVITVENENSLVQDGSRNKQKWIDSKKTRDKKKTDIAISKFRNSFPDDTLQTSKKLNSFYFSSICNSWKFIFHFFFYNEFEQIALNGSTHKSTMKLMFE